MPETNLLNLSREHSMRLKIYAMRSYLVIQDSLRLVLKAYIILKTNKKLLSNNVVKYGVKLDAATFLKISEYLTKIINKNRLFLINNSSSSKKNLCAWRGASNFVLNFHRKPLGDLRDGSIESPAKKHKLNPGLENKGDIHNIN